MKNIAISIHEIGKRYRLGGIRPQYGSLRDTLASALKRLTRRQPTGSQPNRTLWALKDVSFDVHEGEVVGIIGHNGAGKSTLLKILSRITRPTTGKAVINGRVGSLLEVGTGFHPELTGRENIYLNGAILGMKKAEIERKFDEIVAFAEIERFLDTPVKRYSSGMYVRLAFSVAAHLEPEILLVDEVLAVGDAAFQRKCLGKMGDVAEGGRTVVFVSHNMAAVEHLCQEAYLLQGGRLVDHGDPKAVIQAYLKPVNDTPADKAYSVDQHALTAQQSKDGAAIHIRRVELLDLEQRPLQDVGTGDGLIIRVHYHAPRKLVAPAFAVFVRNRYGVELTRLSTMPISGYYIESIEGDGAIDLVLQELPFSGGVYTLSLGVARANVEWLLRLENLLTLQVTARDIYHSGMAIDSQRGFVTLKHRWHLVDHALDHLPERESSFPSEQR